VLHLNYFIANYVADISNVLKSSCKLRNIFAHLKKKFDFPGHSCIKVPPVGSALIHADKETDGRTDVTKLVDTFCDYEKFPKNGIV